MAEHKAPPNKLPDRVNVLCSPAPHRGKSAKPQTHQVVLRDVASGWWFAGIFGGHDGGAMSARLADPERGLAPFLLERLRVVAFNNDTSSEIPGAIERAFVDFDTRLLEDKEFFDGDPRKNSGSSATVVLVNPSQSRAWVAQLGDSRLLLVQDQKFVFGTRDHDAKNRDEIVRLDKAWGARTPGETLRQHLQDDGRVRFGDAAPLRATRAFGDFFAKLVPGDFVSTFDIEPELEPLLTEVAATPLFINRDEWVTRPLIAVPEVTSHSLVRGNHYLLVFFVSVASSVLAAPERLVQ